MSGSRRPRVLIAGAFGQGNPGDQSILDAFLVALDGCDVAVTVGTAPESAVYRPVPSRSRLAVARAVAAADLTIATATVFKTLHPSSGRPPLGLLVNTLAMATLARATGNPVALLGVGAGELPGPAARALARKVMDAAAVVEVRDEESAEILRRAGASDELRVGADVVWATLAGAPRDDPPGADDERRPLAVMALSHLADRPSLVGGLRATAAALVSAGYQVALQPWQLPQDLSMAAAVADGAEAPVAVWDAPADVADAASRLAGARLVVGLRFHSLAAAAAAGVPFVAVTHEPKLAGLARRLDQESVLPSAEPATLAAAALRAARRPPACAVAIERERVQATATLERARQLAFARAGRARLSPPPAGTACSSRSGGIRARA